MYGGLLVLDAAFLARASLGHAQLLVTSHSVDALDEDHVLLRDDREHSAARPEVLPGDDLHFVTRLDVHARHHSTSGAREMIFMNFLSRSSRATGPKMRVPRGCI